MAALIDKIQTKSIACVKADSASGWTDGQWLTHNNKQLYVLFQEPDSVALSRYTRLNSQGISWKIMNGPRDTHKGIFMRNGKPEERGNKERLKRCTNYADV